MTSTTEDKQLAAVLAIDKSSIDNNIPKGEKRQTRSALKRAASSENLEANPKKQAKTNKAKKVKKSAKDTKNGKDDHGNPGGNDDKDVKNVKDDKAKKDQKPREPPILYLAPGPDDEAKEVEVGQPPVWAEQRQALCDATPYFKSHQGGLYTKDCAAIGVLIDKSGFTIRDVIGSDVVVTTMGGGREPDANGTYQRKKDYKPSSLRFWENAKELNQPVVVVAGSEHPELPCRALHRYSVLASFWITDIWPEKYLDHSGEEIEVYKVRLEKVELDQPSWWWDETSEKATDVLAPCSVGQHTAALQKCEHCKVESKQIFTEAWTCLNTECEERFTFPLMDTDWKDLTYSKDFLGERTAFPRDGATLAQIVPPLPSDDVLHTTSVEARVGIVCPGCHCCSRRKYWKGWECENPNCDFVLPATPAPHTIAQLEEDEAKHAEKIARLIEKNSKDPAQSKHEHDDVTVAIDNKVYMQKFELGNYTVYVYILPDEKGKPLGTVVVYRPKKATRKRRGGADDIYLEVENTDLHLQRNAARCGGAYNENLTRHYQSNFGAPYKFGVRVPSRSFKEASDAVLKILNRLQWAGQTAVKASQALIQSLQSRGAEIGADFPHDDIWVDFNEVLALGYMEKDSISYHDDGEKQLGHTVGTMSFGNGSIMSFRPKKSINVTTARGRHPRSKDYFDVLALYLKHGDMVVMYGAAIHRIYEHCVEPMGDRRYAFTSRVIREDAISPAERDIARSMGTLPDNYDDFKYDGDIQTPEQAAVLDRFITLQTE